MAGAIQPINNGVLRSNLDAAGFSIINLNLASFAYQPLDADLTAIAALTTQAFGRGALTQVSASAFRSYIGAEEALTFTAPLLRTTNTVSIRTATGAQSGALSSADWTTFNNKQNHTSALDLWAATTPSALGLSLVVAASPGTTSYVKITDENAIEYKTAAQVLSDIGAQASSANLTSWAAITRASGFDAFVATPSVANFKTLLSNETTVVGNLLSLANPSLITYLRVAADNSVSYITPANLLIDIGGAARGVNQDITALEGANSITAALDTTLTLQGGSHVAGGVTIGAQITLGSGGSGNIILTPGANIKLANLTSNGFVKTSGSDGTLSVDTGSYQPLSSNLTTLASISPTAIGLNLLAVDTPGTRSYVNADNLDTVSYLTPAQVLTDIGAEPALGNPGTNGFILSSTTAGVRSWVAPSSPPFSDSTALVKGSSDATKQLRFEVDGFPTSTLAVLIPPSGGGTIATLAGTEAFTNKTYNGLEIDPLSTGSSLLIGGNSEVEIMGDFSVPDGFGVTLNATALTSVTLPPSGTLYATGGTDVAVADGGTGASTLAAHGVLLGNGTDPVAVTGAGTAGQVLTSNGASADPTFQTKGGGVIGLVHLLNVGGDAVGGVDYSDGPFDSLVTGYAMDSSSGKLTITFTSTLPSAHYVPHVACDTVSVGWRYESINDSNLILRFYNTTTGAPIASDPIELWISLMTRSQ